MIFTISSWFIIALFNLLFLWFKGYDEIKKAYMIGLTIGLAFLYHHSFWLYVSLFIFISFSAIVNLHKIDFIIVGLTIIDHNFLILFFLFLLIAYATYQILKKPRYIYNIDYIYFFSFLSTYLCFCIL
jgi:hypothetical protein